MKLKITPTRRNFDGRTVYLWSVIDERERIRDSGCALTLSAANRAANRSAGDQGPCMLLDILECR